MYPLRRTALVPFAAERVVVHYLSRSHLAVEVFLPIDDASAACRAEVVETADLLHAFSIHRKGEQKAIEIVFPVMTEKRSGVHLQSMRSLRVRIALQMRQTVGRQVAVAVSQGSRRQMIGTFYAPVAFARPLVRKIRPEEVVPIPYEGSLSALRTDEFAAAPVQGVAVSISRI